MKPILYDEARRRPRRDDLVEDWTHHRLVQVMTETDNAGSIRRRDYRSANRRRGQQKYLEQQCKNGLVSFAADICSRENLMHTIPLYFGRHTDRAAVAERAIFATPNALNLQRAKKSNPLFSNLRAASRKLWGLPNATGGENRLILELSALLKSP